jgi:hypothetical protein
MTIFKDNGNLEKDETPNNTYDVFDSATLALKMFEMNSQTINWWERFVDEKIDHHTSLMNRIPIINHSSYKTFCLENQINKVVSSYN